MMEIYKDHWALDGAVIHTPKDSLLGPNTKMI